MPTMTNCRAVEPTSSRPSGPETTANRPIRNEPETLTSSVPHGKVSPKARATMFEHRKRSTPPKPAPRKIQPDRLSKALFQLGAASFRRVRRGDGECARLNHFL